MVADTRKTNRQDASTSRTVFQVLVLSCVACFVRSFAIPPDSYDGPPQTDFCGETHFDPLRQACCGVTLHDIPTKDALCFQDKACWKNDSAECLRSCGNGTYYPDEELCCGGRPIKYATHICCDDSIVLDKSQGMKCCHGILPYQSPSMECNRTATNLTRSVHLNRNHQFDSSTVCKRQILRWLPNWQLFGVPSDMIHLTGLVEACGVKTYSDHLTVPLIFTSTRQDGRPFQTCLSDRRVKNVISHSRRHKCMRSGKEARRYFRGQSVEYFFPESKIDTRVNCSRKSPVVRVSDEDEAFLMFSQRFRDSYN
ncbi:hypothetical protein BaRGS_00016417 [Batillaria attramentaria]|uniref:Galaxin-like repeats domain-containing protein n=1 Tax=Batillaria attramentaria TaxID=370345 RepID=A0ABD0KYU2_9CAEN